MRKIPAMSPACSNPANIRHVVRPSYDGGGKTYCYQECVCGDIVSGDQCSRSVHPPETDGCRCEVTVADCVDCDAEFIPTDAEQDQCTDCIAKEVLDRPNPAATPPV
jgi:hypothetical protein